MGKKRTCVNKAKRHLEDCNMKANVKVVASPSACANQELLDNNSTSSTDCMLSASIVIKEGSQSTIKACEA